MNSTVGVPRERLAWIDTTRGLGVLAVVLFHVLIWNYATLVEEGSAVASLWDQVGSSLGRVRMPIQPWLLPQPEHLLA